MFSNSHSWLNQCTWSKIPVRKYLWPKFIWHLNILLDRHKRPVQCQIFALICLWYHFITQIVICQQPFSYLCQYTHNFWVSPYLKGYRQQLVFWQEDAVFHRQCSGGNHTNAEQLHHSGVLPVPMGMACWWGLENTEEICPPLLQGSTNSSVSLRDFHLQPSTLVPLFPRALRSLLTHLRDECCASKRLGIVF